MDSFPFEETQIVAQNPSSYSQNFVDIMMMFSQSTQVMVATRYKYYGSQNPSNGSATITLTH